MVADEAVDLGVALQMLARLDLAALVGLERVLREDLARQADGGAELRSSRRDATCS